jgi:type II secretion system protein H
MTSQTRNSRSGFTLLETIVVLAILVLVAAMSFPAFDSWLQNQRLSDAVDEVRTNWVKARAHAMQEGRVYRFSWQPGDAAIRIAPDESEFWPDATSGSSPVTEGFPPGYLIEKELPEGIQFQLSPTADAGPDTVLFQPNGTAVVLALDGTERMQTEVALVNRKNKSRVLRLRAITCVATVVNPTAP